MGLTDENGMNTTMLVSPTSAPYGQGGGFGNGMGGDGWWILLLFLLLGNRGWGNGGFGGGSGTGDSLYPWMNQSNQINDGFRDQMINGNINEIRSGVTGLQTQLCNCCGDIQMALANGFAGVEQGANTRQIANMQQAFANQMATSQGFNQLGSQLADCCCENRAGIADLKYTVATENCADRAALADAARDIIASQTSSTQRILDQLCQDKIDAKNDTINQLRQELLYSRGQASQDVQTAALRQSMLANDAALLNELRSCPIPSMPVYGQTPIFTCNQNQCGCGCNNGCGCGM